MTTPDQQLREQLGNIDVYVLDQILRSRIQQNMKILDAGCGHGRNSHFLISKQYNCYGCDQKESSIQKIKELAARSGLDQLDERFSVQGLEKLSYPDEHFDWISCIAVLHFAKSESHFNQMLNSLWRCLKPGGILFCRLAGIDGLEERVKALGDGRYHLPDGSERFLQSQAQLEELTKSLGGELLDPIKTVIVQNMRCMNTWCIRKTKN